MKSFSFRLLAALVIPAACLAACLSTNTGNPTTDARNAKINSIATAAGQLVAKAVVDGAVNAGMNALEQELNTGTVNMSYVGSSAVFGAAPDIASGTTSLWDVIQTSTNGTIPNVSQAAQKAYDDAIAKLQATSSATKQAKLAVIAAVATGLNNGAATATSNTPALIPTPAPIVPPNSPAAVIQAATTATAATATQSASK